MNLLNRVFRIIPVVAVVPLAACALNVGDDSVEGGTAYFERIRLQDKFNTAVRGDRDIAEAALDYVAEQNEITEKLSLGDNFLVRSKLIGTDGLHHVRMTQAYDGIKVWGAEITVHASDETFSSVNGGLVKQLEGFDTTPVLDNQEALSIGLADYETLAKTPGANLEYTRDSSELVVFPMAERNMKLAYHVVFYTELQDDINPGLWNYFVDAQTGEILEKFNGIHTAAGDLAQASGQGGNAKHTNTWTNYLDVTEQSNGSYNMDSARLRTVDMNNSQSGNGTVVNGPSLTNFGDPAINDAHGYGEVTLNMMLDWYGYASLDEQGFQIKSRVHYGSNYENAFWDGTQMTYGDGASYFYPLSGALDVVAHEFHHGFTTFHSNLTYSAQSGGLNESFSDIVGTIAEFYWENQINGGNTADWDLGEDVFQSPTGALRYMCNPPADGKSIDNAANYYSGLDVHYSSGVSNKAFCLAAKRLATGDPNGTATAASVKRAGQAWYVANASYWNASTNYIEGCQGIMDAANALGFSAAEKSALSDSWLDVGVACDGAPQPVNCDITYTAESGTFTSPNYPSAYPNNANQTWCVQPAGGSPATLTFDAFDTELNYDFVEVKDANGAILSNTSGNTAPADATSTMLVVKFTSDGSVTKTGFSASWSTGAVQNDAPTVAITAPVNGDTISGTVTVTADANDADGTIASVTFTFADGTSSTDTTAPYSASWDSSATADGAATISVQASDNLGATASDSISVNVSNGTDCASGNYANNTSQSIPDNNATGINSTVSVTGAGTVQTLAVSVNITHTWKGDLIVNLTSPSGTVYNLHNRTGSSTDNVIITGLDVTAFTGENAAGAWTLTVSDNAGADLGTLNSWSLDLVGDCGGGGGGGGAWTGSDSPNLALVDNGSACTTLSVAGSGASAGVMLSVSGNHSWRSILRGTLEHNGTTVEAFPTGTFASDTGAFSFTDRAVAGISGDAGGAWTLCIVDTDAYGDSGTLGTWSVHN